MKIRSFTSGLLCLLILGSLFSCEKTETIATEKPTILIKEVGINNSKIAYTGHDLHLDVEIKAPAKIASVKVQITLAETNYAWDFVKTYTEGYAGLKNANFHEHVDVPENAKVGEYTLLIVVIDEMGGKTQSKVDFNVVKDLTLPSITGIGLDTSSPDLLNISGTMNAPNKIKKLEIEVQSSAWTRLFTYEDAEWANQTSFPLNKDIDISAAPNGHYHVNIRLIDQTGANVAYHYHFDKK